MYLDGCMNELGVAGAEYSSLKAGGVGRELAGKRLGEDQVDHWKREPALSSTLKRLRGATIGAVRFLTLQPGRDGTFDTVFKALTFTRTGDTTYSCVPERDSHPRPSSCTHCRAFWSLLAAGYFVPVLSS